MHYFFLKLKLKKNLNALLWKIVSRFDYYSSIYGATCDKALLNILMHPDHCPFSPSLLIVRLAFAHNSCNLLCKVALVMLF